MGHHALEHANPAARNAKSAVLSRRRFLRLAVAAAGGAVLWGCAREQVVPVSENGNGV